MRRSDIFIKLTAAVLMAVLTASALPVFAAESEKASTDQLYERLIEEGGYTEEEINNDPGFWRLSGLEAALENGEEEEADLSPVQKSTETGTPFNDKQYTHSDEHDRYLVLNGVDISSYQKTIDWDAAKNAGVNFALVRVGYRGYSGTGKLMEDPYYAENLANAPRAGVNTGVYIYSQATTVEEAIEEADFVLSRIGGYKVTLPVVFDFEYASTGGGVTGRLYNANLSREQATDLCLAFCGRVKAAGYEPMVYANKNMLSEHLNDYAITGAGYKIWLAHYTVKSSYTGKYDYWQYTSTGRVNGIQGNVDCNFWYVWVEASGIRMDQDSVSLEAGSRKKISASLTPANASNAISWSSSDRSIAEVSSDGEITGVNVGSAVITASVGGYSSSCSVTVTVPPVRGINVERTLYETAEGQSFTINASVFPESALNKVLHWSTNDANIADVDQYGRVTGKSVGTAYIIVSTDEGGFSQGVEVRVMEQLRSLEVDQDEVTIMKGEAYLAKAITVPSTTNWDIEWRSMNELVATVDENGVITAQGIGKTLVTATAGMLSARITVTVSGKTATIRSAVRLSGMDKFNPGDIRLTLTSIADGAEAYAMEGTPSNSGAAFSFEAYEGDYDVRISKPGYTSYIQRNFTAGINVFPSTVILFPGDANNDGHVNIRDVAYVKSLTGITSEGSSYTVSADFNDDGVINNDDFAYMLKGYGLSDNIIE